MKKIAILGSRNGSNFEAIFNWFQTKNVDITCISDKKDALILKKAQNLQIKNIHLPFEKNYEYFSENKFDLIVLAGYMRILPEKVLEEMNKVINIHPSLLPAFKGKNAIKDAFLHGVKVTGVSIHLVDKKVDEGKILAQYPVFITSDMRLNDLEEEIHTIEHKLYPIVIEKILEDKVFDFSDLLSSKNDCKGCGGCSKH